MPIPMSTRQIHPCQCPNCLHPDPHPDKRLHRHMNLLLCRLNEQQRRWYVAVESEKIGHGGDKMLSRITGMHVETIRRGRRELETSLDGRPSDRVRLAGGGRKATEKKMWL